MSYQEIYHQIKYYTTQFVLLIVCTKNMHNVYSIVQKKFFHTIFKYKWYNLNPPIACCVNLEHNESEIVQDLTKDSETNTNSVDSSASD